MNKTKIAINGFGRIGRAAFRIISERDDCEVVAINDLTDNETLAHLLQYDSVFRKYDKEVTFDDENIIVDGKKYFATAEPEPVKLPWGERDVDVVLECTGFFVKGGTAYGHIDAGAKRVVISAPAKGEGDVDTYVLGVSEPTSESTLVISNASCTTNCIAPVMKVLDENFGVEKSLMTTIHSYTSTQNLQDGPAKDLRKARAAAQNIIPTTTGAAVAATLVLPQLKEKFDGMAMRVPTIDASISDITLVTKKDVTQKEINDAFITAASGELKGILGVTDDLLVSGDFIGDERSTIVDLPLTKVIGGNLVKVVAWYDNEWGYSVRLVDMAVQCGEMIE
ncbi:MAG: type I glyceraldehyde-3-phosphate dehydrogenase [Patescibacteria group bacterium]|nr:type I glyceraldehyde-3-phosphate dehydrogenase [Patescibacteria group bacterium]